jgi:hypothetical protein
MSTGGLEELMTRPDDDSLPYDDEGSEGDVGRGREEWDGTRERHRKERADAPYVGLWRRGPADGVVLSLTRKGDGFYDVYVLVVES